MKKARLPADLVLDALVDDANSHPNPDSNDGAARCQECGDVGVAWLEVNGCSV